MTGERGLDAARKATVQVVRVRDSQQEHRGQGLLLDVGEEKLVVLTCHHVVAPCSPDELFVKIRQDDGQLGELIHVVVDEKRSHRHQDAVVLQINRADVLVRRNPLLYEVNHTAFVGPLSATGIMYLSPYVFDGEVRAGDSITVKATQSEGWPLDSDTYRARMFRLGLAGDARPGISGAVVVCDEGILGLAEAARKESAEVGREVYLLPLGTWADEWPALSDLIEPFIDHQLRSAATIKPVRDLEIGTDIVVEEFRPDVYLSRPVNEVARMALDLQEGVVIVGRPESGKTRLAWNLLHIHPNAIVVIPTTDEPPMSFEPAGLRGRELILFFDDLHRTAQKSKVLMWRNRLQEATGQKVRLLCTSRDGAGEWRDGVCQYQQGLLDVLGTSGQIFLSAGDNRGEDLTGDEGRLLANMLGLDEVEFESRFDGTPGSLLLQLDEMRVRYETLKRASRGDVSMSRLLDSAKLLYAARQPRFSERQLKLVAETIRGNRPLSPEEWEMICLRTQEEGFGRFDQQRNFQIYLPYLEKCVLYEPDLESVERLLPSFEAERNLEALFYLSLVFVDLKPEVAERALRTVIEEGAGEAYNNLGLLLSKQPGREAEAEELLRQALAVGNTEALLNLAILLHEQGEHETEAEELYRLAIAAGDTNAIFNLGNLLSNQAGRETEAENMYRRAIASGKSAAYLMLGNLLCKQAGREAEAEAVYRQALAAGRTNAYNNLGLLLSNQAGREVEAEDMFRRALATGHNDAYNNLGILLSHQAGREAEAEDMYRQALTAGHTQAYLNLGTLFWQQAGHEAEDMYRQAIAAGHTEAYLTLGLVQGQQAGREAEAEDVYRQAIAAGRTDTYNNLGNLLSGQAGREAEAEDAFVRALTAGEVVAYVGLGNLLARQTTRREEGCQMLVTARLLGLPYADDLFRELCDDSP